MGRWWCAWWWLGVFHRLGFGRGFPVLVFGFVFGLVFGFISAMSKRNSSAANGRLGGRPPSLVCSISPGGGQTWSLAGDVVSPRVLPGGWAEHGGRYYSAAVGSAYPAPGVHRFAARRCGPESVGVPAVPVVPVLDDIIYLPCGSPVRRSHIWQDMEAVRLAAIERAMDEI